MKRVAILALIIFSTSIAFSQIDKNTIKSIEKVKKEHKNQNYKLAQDILKSTELKNNPIINYWKAKIHLAQAEYKKAEKIFNEIYSLGDLNFSYQKENSIPFDVYVLSADTKRRLLKIDDALKILNEAKLKAKGNTKWQSIIEKEISYCTTFNEYKEIKGKSKVAIKKEWSTKNNEINFTSSADLTKIVYSVEVYDNNKKSLEQKTIGMYLSGLPQKAIISSISVDSRYLLFAYDNDIFLTTWQKGFWKKSERMPKPINSSYIEKDAIFSVDNRTILFSSNREGGLGGFDIYMVKKNPDDTWGEAINLGSAINSSANEETPFLRSDLNTLYFSSNGRKNMGGYDIFISEINEENKWDEAQNMGLPINSPADEKNLWMHPNNADAFFISNRKGSLGQSDIYKLTIIPEKQEDNMVLLIGTVRLDDEAPIENVQITISDRETDEIAGVFLPNKVSGKFIFLLIPDREYKALYEAEGYLSYVNYFSVVQDSAYYKIKQGVNLDPVVFYNPPSIILNQKTVIHDIFFESNSTEIKDNYKNELDNLGEYLKKNPQSVIQIAAHSDATSSEAYNLTLTQKRANSAKNYLIEKGINPNQVQAKGFGEKNPIATNISEDGKKYNRRIEFKLLEKGNQEIEIQAIFVPKTLRIK
ncbi:MAG: OmpA family protein [Bacteroidales bacterium]|nr:OmpA family protein [Bacteroidales bacterium]